MSDLDIQNEFLIQETIELEGKIEKLEKIIEGLVEALEDIVANDKYPVYAALASLEKYKQQQERLGYSGNKKDN